MNSMVLFCFKNVRFAKFIKRELRMNIEFWKIGSDKVWGKKVEGLVLSLVIVSITHCPVSMSSSGGTRYLTGVTRDIFKERSGLLLLIWRYVRFCIAAGKRKEIEWRKILTKRNHFQWWGKKKRRTSCLGRLRISITRGRLKMRETCQ